MQPVFIYCYDAYCGWCYGFSPVISKAAEKYKDQFHFEVLSGGMIPAENSRPISAMAGYIREGYKRVEEMTGIEFGKDYLWHIFNAEQSDWFPHSEKAAAALCIFKEMFPENQVKIAAELQYALHYEGRDLTDDEAYRHLLEKYGVKPDYFYSQLHSETYKEKALYEFALCKQLRVTGFPQVLLQATDQQFHLLARGYTDFDTLDQRIQSVLAELNTPTA
jgi:putative protein-disulfide isomerase